MKDNPTVDIQRNDLHTKVCIVTTSWDDGHQMDEKLSSLLLDYGIKGTFYVSKNWKKSSDNTDLIKKLDRNFEIGAHTLSHPILTGIPLEDAFREIEGSKEWLEELLHHKIEMFCYPKGRYNDQVVELVKQSGFIGARTTNFDLGFPSNPYMLGLTCQASNGSPLLRFRALLKSRISLRSLLDWENSSKILFDYVLEIGGVWHLWGHSWEIEKSRDWKKLEDVFEYVSNRGDARYLENTDVAKLAYR